MRLHHAANGKSALVLDDRGRELGLVVRARGGRQGHTLWGAYSVAADGFRLDWGMFPTLETAVERVAALAADGDPPGHRVLAEAVERRRFGALQR